jgi:hypothetical protein
MQDLSIKNAAKEGISLGKAPVQFVYINMLQGFKYIYTFVSQDQCCGYGMFIPDPDIFSILEPDLTNKSDPGSNKKAKKRGGGISCFTFFVGINFTKLKIVYF